MKSRFYAILAAFVFSLIGPVLMLTACTSAPPGTAPAVSPVSQALAEAAKINTVLIKMVAIVNATDPTAFSKAGVNVADLTNGRTGKLDLAGQALATLLASPVPPPGTPTLGQVQVWLNDVVNAVAPVVAVVDPALAPEMAAVQVLLPLAETLLPGKAGARVALVAPPSHVEANATLDGFLAKP